MSNTNNSVEQATAAVQHALHIAAVAQEQNVSQWRAHEMIVENAASRIDGVNVVAQQERTYMQIAPTRADIHLSSPTPGGPTVVIDAKDYSGNLPRSEIDKLLRDVHASRSSGGIIVLSRDLISDENRQYAAENGIAIVVANRNLSANLRSITHDMFAASGETPPELRVTPSGAIDRRSAAVRSGDVLLTNDGSIDRRSAAVQRGDVRVRDDGTAHASSRAMQSTPSATAAFAAALIQPSAAATPVARNSSAVHSGNVMFTQAGDIDRRSAAVRSGDLRFNTDGSIDRRSAAVRSGEVRVNSSGKVGGGGRGGGGGGGGKSGKK